MRARSRRPFLFADVAVLVVVGALVLALGLSGSGGGHESRADIQTVTVIGPDRPIPAGFVGLSLEYTAIEPYAGSDPAALDPVFEQLVRNLNPGQRPVLRIGGDTTDWTWWPGPGLALPAGVTFALDQRWLAVTNALSKALDARLILGINLEAGSSAVASAEARALLAGLPRRAVTAFEIGNEPELYGVFAWYHTAGGRSVPGRPSSYSPAAFTQDWSAIAAGLPSLPLAGPAISGNGWLGSVGAFVAAEPRLGMVTLHRYPLQLCFVHRSSPHYPSIANLLAPTASRGLADALAPSAALAHAHRLPLRIDEINSVSCGASPAISHTFATALWALDSMFALVHDGIDGVNIHTFPGAGYELFSLSHGGGRWRAAVLPEYYGLMMFAKATPAGSTLLRTDGSGPVRVWATRGSDGSLRLVLINPDMRSSHDVAVRVGAGVSGGTLERLVAPSAAASSDVTLGGQSFGAATSSGRLAGVRSLRAVSSPRGTVVVSMPAASAALLTLR